MSINFEPNENTAFDEGTGVTISHPRILPATRSDGSEALEYQYTFRRNGERVGAMGFFGTEDVSVVGGQRAWTQTLDLSPDAVLMDMLRFKQVLGKEGDEFTFICALAEGLLNVFAGSTGNLRAVRYLAISTSEALTRVGAPGLGTHRTLPDGTVILACLAFPAHAP